MINYTASTVQAFFDFLKQTGAKNGVDQSKVSSILPFANNPQSNSQSARQAAEVSELVVATVMFGPEIGIIYFNNIFDKLAVLIAQALSNSSSDINVNLQISAGIKSNFPYSFQQYADKSAIDNDSILVLLATIATNYVSTLKSYLSHVSNTAPVVQSMHLVDIQASLSTDAAPVNSSLNITKARLAAITSNIQTGVSDLFRPIRTVIADFVVAAETTINDLVLCFSEMYQGIYSLNTNQILKNTQRLDNIVTEIQNLIGISLDGDMIKSAVTLREKAEDLAWYALQVKPAESVTKVAIGNFGEGGHHYRGDCMHVGYLSYLCWMVALVIVLLIVACARPMVKYEPMAEKSVQTSQKQRQAPNLQQRSAQQGQALPQQQTPAGYTKPTAEQAFQQDTPSAPVLKRAQARRASSPAILPQTTTQPVATSAKG